MMTQVHKNKQLKGKKKSHEIVISILTKYLPRNNFQEGFTWLGFMRRECGASQMISQPWSVRSFLSWSLPSGRPKQKLWLEPGVRLYGTNLTTVTSLSQPHPTSHRLPKQGDGYQVVKHMSLLETFYFQAIW